jgi:alpha-beta hydrolase superfamily lysophospholipase
MLKRSEGYFRGKDDFELYFQAWTPAKPVATLVITHGLGEHTDCYQRLVDGLSDQNVQMIAWDMRGHGRSEGKRGVVRRLSDYSADQVMFIEFIRNEISKRPIGMVSHSLGGLVTLNTLIRNPELDIKCAVLSSPLLGVQVEVPELKKIGAKYLAEYLPSLTMWNELDDRILTHEKKILQEFAKDPLRHDRVSPRLYLDMLAYAERIKREGGSVTLPILFQLSGQDKVVSTKASEGFFANVKSKDKELKIYENSYHEIYNDIERDVCFADIKVFLKKHLTK